LILGVDGLNAGVLIGIIIGALLGCGCCTYLVLYGYMWYEARKEASEGMIILRNVNLNTLDDPSSDYNEDPTFIEKVTSIKEKIGDFVLNFNKQKIKPD
jgi:hypothetical protein